MQPNWVNLGKKNTHAVEKKANVVSFILLLQLKYNPFIDDSIVTK
jgi:hypothetical protein